MELTIAETNFLYVLLTTVKDVEKEEDAKFTVEEMIESPFFDTIISKCKEEMLIFKKNNSV